MQFGCNFLKPIHILVPFLRLSVKLGELELRLIRCKASFSLWEAISGYQLLNVDLLIACPTAHQRNFQASLFQETQDELTTELVDLKDKYREVVELLRDAQEDLRRSRKRTYPGMGKQTGMFTSLPLNKGNQLGCKQICTVSLRSCGGYQNPGED